MFKDRQTILTVLDLLQGGRQWRLWTALAWQDIKLRYRRTVLGPFWVTLTTAIMIICLGLLWGLLFGQDLTTYFPYVAAGYIIWQTVGIGIIDGCESFTSASDIILNRKVPLSLFSFRLAYRHLLVFLHNITVFVLVAIVFPVDLNLYLLIAFPALLVILVNICWVSLALGILGARFRDLPPIVNSLVSVLFFATPIFWKKEMLHDRAIVADFNPMTHFIEILRDPLLGAPPSKLSWLVVVCVTILGWAVTLALFRRSRSRIVYWL